MIIRWLDREWYHRAPKYTRTWQGVLCFALSHSGMLLSAVFFFRGSYCYRWGRLTSVVGVYFELGCRG